MLAVFHLKNKHFVSRALPNEFPLRHDHKAASAAGAGYLPSAENALTVSRCGSGFDVHFLIAKEANVGVHHHPL